MDIEGKKEKDITNLKSFTSPEGRRNQKIKDGNVRRRRRRRAKEKRNDGIKMGKLNTKIKVEKK